MIHDPKFGRDVIPVTNENATVIKQAVVLEIVGNPVLFKDDEFLNQFFQKLENSPTPYFNTTTIPALRKQLKMAPRNTVIAVLIGDATTGGGTPKVFYPLFSQHLCLPVKPGENVWIISEGLQNSFSVTQQDTSNKGDSASMGELICSGYWMSRVVAPDYAEDVNFTHADRARSQEYVAQQQQDGQQGTLPPPPFHNGMLSNDENNLGLPNKYTLPQSNDYTRIYKDSLSNRLTTREPIPEFTKRPGDIVIQGSNNALICIGEDRPNPGDGASNVDYKVEEALTKPRLDAKAGTIDMVTGRVLVRQEQSFVLDPEKITTVPNAREGETEKEKRPWARVEGQPALKLNEGDISFLGDLSRVYISMKTDGDKNMGYEEPNMLPKRGEEFPSLPVDSSAYVIARSKEIRIIASQERDQEGVFSDDVATAGSIRIIKEGKRDEEGHSIDQGIIQLNPDGTLIIDSPSMIIGSGKEAENGAGTQVYIGNNATEPLVLGNELKTLLDTHFDNIKMWLSSKFDTHMHPTGVGPSGPPTVVGDDAGTGASKGNTSKLLSKNAKTK